MKKRRRKVNQNIQRRAQAAAAMPDVKRLVKKYGRLAVGNCIAKIRARDKEAAKLAALKREVANLERGLR